MNVGVVVGGECPERQRRIAGADNRQLSKVQFIRSCDSLVDILAAIKLRPWKWRSRVRNLCPLVLSPTFQRERERENFDSTEFWTQNTIGQNVTRIFITFDEKKFLGVESFISDSRIETRADKHVQTVQETFRTEGRLIRKRGRTYFTVHYPRVPNSPRSSYYYFISVLLKYLQSYLLTYQIYL